jgi:DNA polymerase-3 subunit delta'
VSALAGIDDHPHARAVLGGVLAGGGAGASHAYLFHGPAGSGKRELARSLAAVLLTTGSPDPDGARARVQSGAHPDLTWVSPSGAAEMLVSDVDEPVVAAATRTPFESSRRVFVIERAETLNDAAANRMLKTLEEPAPFVHLILLTDHLGEVMPTIVSRCQLVRFDARPPAAIAERLTSHGIPPEQADACARLALGDGDRALELALGDGVALRAAAERLARASLARDLGDGPWSELLAIKRRRGDAAARELEARLADELELVPRKDRRRVENEWAERIRRARRRVETRALDLGLQLVALWYRDLACLGWEAPELVAHTDRAGTLEHDAAGAPDPQRLRAAVELVEETRRRLELNVSEELACEALAYRLERTLAPSGGAPAGL